MHLYLSLKLLIKLSMKRLRNTSNGNKMKIDIQLQKQNNPSEVKNKLAILTIDNTCLNQSPQKTLGNSTTRMTLTSSLKKSNFYRKFMNHSVSSNHYQRESAKSKVQNSQSHNQQISFERYPKKTIKMLSDKDQIVENNSERHYEDIVFKNINIGKIKSFESFLKNKKRQNEKVFPNNFKRGKFLKLIQNNIPVGGKFIENDSLLNLSGKGINRLKDQSQSQRRNCLGESMYTNNKLSTVDESQSIQIHTKMRSIQSEWHNQKHQYNHPYVKYYFTEDQGYCPFDKILNPLSTKKSIQNNKRILYFNLHKDLRKSKLSHPGKKNYLTNNIEGWIVSTEQEQDMCSNTNILK